MFKSIKGRLITSFLVSISICLIAMAIIISYVVNDNIKKEFITSTQNEMIKVEEIINTYFDEMKNNGDMLAENPTVKSADESITNYVNVKGPSGKIKVTPEKNGGIEQEIYEVYENFSKAHPNTSDVFFGTVGGSYIQYAEGSIDDNYDPRERPWYKQALENPDQAIVTDAYYWSGSDEVNISIVKPVQNNWGVTIGVQAIDVALRDLTDMISRLKVGENGYVIIVESTGNILSHPGNPKLNFENISQTYLRELADKSQGSFDIKDEGEDIVTNIHTSKDNGWKYISVVPKSELTQKTKIINSSIFIISVIILIVSVLISILISNGISRPIQEIRDLMKEVEVGNFNVRSDIEGQDEVGQLSDSFNNMTENIKNLIQSSQEIALDIMDSTNVLNDMSQQISISSEEVTEAISSLAEDTYEQAGQSDGIISSIEHITSDIKIISSAIGQKTDSAKELASQGLLTVSCLEDITKNTASESQIAFENIVNIINDIKEETLILNDSIEKMDYEKEKAADAIYSVSRSSEYIAATSEEITASSEEQTSSIRRMSSSIDNLRNLSNDLKNSIAKFKI